MVNYIVVGTDCAGKSTLVNQLAEVIEYKVVKGSSFELSQCTQDELYEKFLEFTEYTDTIFDRFSYCNKAYATLYDDYAMLSSEQRREIEWLSNAIVIYLYADDDVLIERFNSRGDDYVNADNLLKAKQLYEEELENIRHLEVIKYDTGKMTTHEIIEDILLNH